MYLAHILLFALPLVFAAPSCLRFADSQTINQLFIDGGPGTKVLLCPLKTYRLTGTIVFTAADQELATYGYPSGSERAKLIVNAPEIATAIQGDCRRCARISIRSLSIDGNRGKLGRMIDYEASGLIVIGGNEGQSITHCAIRDPRGFTAIHVREGDKLSCSKALLEKNEIGPVGDEYIPEVDGDDPETSPLGRPLADGLTIACRDSIVRDNHFADNTDAAIVVYCSPGTLVHANQVQARKLSAMAGILAVDASPFDGDYSKTVIKGNIIDAASKTIRVGIGLGAAILSDDTDTILKGGTVIGNGIKGKYMGYGIAASGLDGWVVKDNWDEANHQGRRSARCFEDFVNPDPVPYLRHTESIKHSDFQSGFADGEFQYLMCLDGLDTEARSHQEHKAEAPVEEQDPKPVAEEFSTGSEVMDEILEHSQTRMLEAIDQVSRKMEHLSRPDVKQSSAQLPLGASAPGEDADVASALAVLNRRMDVMESRQRGLVQSAHKMREGFKGWYDQYSAAQEWQNDAILGTHNKLKNMARPKSKVVATKPKKRKDTGATWTPIVQLIIAQAVAGLLLVLLRRWWKRRERHSKLS